MKTITIEITTWCIQENVYIVVVEDKVKRIRNTEKRKKNKE